MENYKKLIEFLEKDPLNPNERNLLAKLLNENEDLHKYYQTYKSLENSIPIQGHPSVETLGEYSLYKNKNTEINNSIIKIIPEIEKHLRECKTCTNVLLQLNEEYSSIDNFLNNRIKKENKVSEEKSKIRHFIINPRFTYARISFASILIIGIVYSILFFISSLSITPSEKLGTLDNKTDYYISRGRVSDEFQKSLIALENGNYDGAIEFLEKDIKANPDDETIFYSYYIIGLIKLESARVSLLGLFPYYNNNTVSEGINYLQMSIERNKSGQFSNINYNAYYFIGKGNLMLNNIPQAKKYFELVISNKGGKIDEARELLDELR
jgi:tetratricopeptide (TPR) repeat protein